MFLSWWATRVTDAVHALSYGRSVEKDDRLYSAGQPSCSSRARHGLRLHALPFRASCAPEDAGEHRHRRGRAGHAKRDHAPAADHRRRGDEVYDIGIADASDLIVRISRDKDKHFEQERWAPKCATLDIPAPRILAIEHLSDETGPLDLCIQAKIEGRVLTPAVLAALTSGARRDIGFDLGTYLARLHAVRVDGVGYLDRAGRGAPPPPSTALSARDRRAFEKTGDRTGFGRDRVLAGLER